MSMSGCRHTFAVITAIGLSSPIGAPERLEPLGTGSSGLCAATWIMSCMWRNHSPSDERIDLAGIYAEIWKDAARAHSPLAPV
jgi:hypothetical protein